MAQQIVQVLEGISNYLFVFGALVLIIAFIIPHISINTQWVVLSNVSKYSAIGIGCIGFVLIVFASFPKFLGNRLQTITVPFEVSSIEGGWQSSGVQVTPNTMLKIEVESGSWTTNKSEMNPIYSAGEGRPFSCSLARYECVEPLPNFCTGGLIARIGESRPFPVGRQALITTPHNGLLSFRINDAEDGLKDNFGSLNIRITLNPVLNGLSELGQMEVKANEEWGPTGIFLDQNMRVMIEVVQGEWSNSSYDINYTTGSGGCYVCSLHGRDCDLPLPSFNVGGLIAKIGRDIYPVGQRNIISVKQKGELLLMMNDNFLTDNRGHLVVSIKKVN